MRIVIIGPTHPYKGGITQHTTQLAHTLCALGEQVHIESWKNQYPARLYKGQLTVPADQPEMPEFPNVTRELCWNRPDSWISSARRAARADVAVLVVANPVQIIPYLTMLPLLHHGGATVVGLVHNVLPHEHSPWDRPLTERFLKSVDLVVTHSDEQATVARELGAEEPLVLDLPPNLDPQTVPPLVVRSDQASPLRLLFFGLVRPYKGLGILLDAMTDVPQAHLTIAGEFWSPVEETQSQISSLGLDDRVVIRRGYVPTSELPGLFGAIDLVVLPYRSVTGSGNTKMALLFNRPLVVSDIGVLPAEVKGGVGLTFRSEDPTDLARALLQAANPTTYNDLAQHVAAVSHSAEVSWKSYAQGLLERLR
ncbi:glycosyltransferase [Schaalia naturae]|uniref:Glycosyltransferase n=1 Tax=Schaalia naturae TaxID=635203 RepID=A0ABW2SJ52_9ACTO